MLRVDNTKDQGFVLPYVLAVIAILAIATTIAAERLQRSTHILAEMQSQNRIERQLATAEAEAVYALLTGKIVAGSVDLNPASPIVSDLGFTLSSVSPLGPDDIDIERDLWPGKGGTRLSDQQDGQVIIKLRDVSGFVSLSGGSTEEVGLVLGQFGLSKNASQGLTAKLTDYTDEDNQRQFKGAERADYRLQQKPPPTNSPLRNYNELTNVLGWDKVLKDIDLLRLMRMTSISPVAKVRKHFASSELIEILGQERDREEGAPSEFNIADLEALSPNLTDTSRLTFWAKTQDGLYHERVIEIRRQANNIEKPFRRFWVYETTVLEDNLELDLDTINEIKNVIHAAPVRLP